MEYLESKKRNRENGDKRDFKAEKRARKEKKMQKAITALKEAEEKELAEKQKELQVEMERKEKGRDYTVAIALPGSILDNAQGFHLRTYLAGQIARAAAVFNVDEIVIFDESGAKGNTTDGEYNSSKLGNCNVTMKRILEYLECPQYLRKALHPPHKDLEYAGVLNPLVTPHHPGAYDTIRYREGVVLNLPPKEGSNPGSLVNVGLLQPVIIDVVLPPQTKVTVDMGSESYTNTRDAKKHRCRVVAHEEPRRQKGLYWGYEVRLASSLGAVFAESPHRDNCDQGYDVTIGTSERGDNVDDFVLPEFKHLLVVFGGVHGLEISLEADEELKFDDPALLFDHYLNTCPNQGSGTIRTEEAIPITMAALRKQILSAGIK